MTQHERILTRRVDVAEELKCLRDECDKAYVKSLDATISHARILHRIDELSMMLLRRPPEAAAQMHSAAAPTAPVAQGAEPASVEAAAYPRETEETAEICRSCLRYDPDTGILTWANPRSHRVKKGDKAGTVSEGRGGKSYILVKIAGKNFSAHRIAWLLYYGKWPDHEILHDNLNGEDNRILNLTEGDRFDVTQNNSLRHDNKSGAPGVRLDEVSSQNKPWRARITRDGQSHSLGIHATQEEAIAARVEAERKYHSGQSATVSQSESAASADTAPAPDARTETMEEPRVPRRPPEVRNAGGGLVQDGGSTGAKAAFKTVKDRAVDEYAATGDHYLDIAKRTGTTANTVGVAISSARTANDPRAKAGDEKRAARLTNTRPAAATTPKPTPDVPAAPVRTQTDEILDLWETTDLSAEEIAQKLGLNPNAPSARISAARSTGDKRAAAGDLRRAGQHAQNHMPVPDGHLIRVEVGSNTGRVFGPGGRWDTTVICAKALSVLCDGQLYGIQRMDQAAGLKRPHTAAELVPLMQAGLKKIGVDLVHTKGIGCRLRPLSEAA